MTDEEPLGREVWIVAAVVSGALCGLAILDSFLLTSCVFVLNLLGAFAGAAVVWLGRGRTGAPQAGARAVLAARWSKWPATASATP